MGGEVSQLVPMPGGFDYMCIAFRTMDRIRTIYATDQEINIIRETIMQHYPKGIQEERGLFGGVYEFKLRGRPFCAAGSSEEAIAVRKLACNLLHRLYNFGCKILVSSDLARTTDVATWVFHREATQTAQFRFGCIGVSSTDSLLFVDFPTTMHQMLIDTVAKYWPQTIQKTELYGDTLKVKLRGNPWMHIGSNSANNIQSKTLIKSLINQLDLQQWILYTSSNLKGTSDTLFFKYDPTLPPDGSRLAGFVITLNRNDRLRCIDCPQDAVDCLRNAIALHWRYGIQDQKMKFNAFEFKLAGTPWWADGEMAVDSRLLICKIIEGLCTIGWRIQLSIDLSRKINDKSVLTFQRCPPMSVPILCLSLNSSDRIRVINGPQDVVVDVANEVKRLWYLGIQREGQYGASYELKLRGNPWCYGFSGHDGAHGRVVLLHLLRLLANKGWFIVLSADVSSKYVHQDKGPDYPLDVHSWWFMYMGGPAPSIAPPTQFGMFNQPAQVFGMAQTLEPPPPYDG